MNFNQIKELLEIFNESNLSQLSIEEKDFKLSMDKQVTSAPVSVQAQPQVVAPVVQEPVVVEEKTTSSKEGDFITSPMVGHFYQAPSPDSSPFVKVGSKVAKGDTVCIVEAMKIMNEIEAEYDCEILEVLVKDGQAVEFGTPLFRVKKV